MTRAVVNMGLNGHLCLTLSDLSLHAMKIAPYLAMIRIWSRICWLSIPGWNRNFFGFQVLNGRFPGSNIEIKKARNRRKKHSWLTIKYPIGESNPWVGIHKSLKIKSLQKTQILSCPPAWTILCKYTLIWWGLSRLGRNCRKIPKRQSRRWSRHTKQSRNETEYNPNRKACFPKGGV